MKRTSGLQKILYVIMLVLGAYILYKAAGILMDSRAIQRALDSGEVQRHLEDAAMRTYAPGYTATVEEREKTNWLAGWMRQLVPVYSYLTDGQALQRVTDIEGTDAEEPDVGVLGEDTLAQQDPDPFGVDLEENPGQESEDILASGIEDIQKQQDAQPVFSTAVSNELLHQLEDFGYLVSNYYTVDEGTMADAELLNAEDLLQEDLRLTQNPDVPQVLIYHTHSQETFLDSEEGNTEDSIVGMGEILAEELRDTYGYNVIHDTGIYDLVDGVLDRSAAYDYARNSIEGILQKYPTIEVIIDLHRDGVDGQKFVTEIDGKPTSMIMFFNGISRDSHDQPLAYLGNPYLRENLAFSLQLQLAAKERYPGFTRNIYLKAERFNLHLRPRSLLIEAGTQLNTVEEERNAMKPLADLLHQVLSG